MEREIIGQALGIIATVLTFISYQFKTSRSILIIQTTATAFTCLSFFFLDASSGFMLNIVCIVRNVVFYFEKASSKTRYVSLPVLCAAFVLLGILSWQGTISLLIIAALFANTVFLSLENPQLLRKSVLVTSTLVLIYNVYVFSIGGITNEAIAIISSAIGIIRFRKCGSLKDGADRIGNRNTKTSNL